MSDPEAKCAARLMEDKKQPPHVVIFPLPLQGHVNSMLQLAELLALSGLKVTFLNSPHNHNHLPQFADVPARFTKFPGFEFRTVPDGLADDHPRTGRFLLEMLDGMIVKTKPSLRDLLVDINPSVDCIIGDGILGYLLDIGEELEIPVIQFRTISACCLWVYYRIPDLIGAGEIPVGGNEDMDRLIKMVEGMENFLRGRDLPSFCRAKNLEVEGTRVQTFAQETRRSATAHALILNTFEDLEGPILSHIRTKFPKIYTIGPLHAHLRTKLSEKNLVSSDSLNGIREVDRSCISWLDQQAMHSVVYVSFGSIAGLTREQLLEVWYGLVKSKVRFLWVVRPDSVLGHWGDEDVPVELMEGTEERGYLVDWAPQEEVLDHWAVGGFLTHSGWNSTLESVVAGVPMICWPQFADQHVNSRYVSEVWKIGLDMKDFCDRHVVEKLVNDLMEEKREEFVGSARTMAKLAKESVSFGGSSYCNLDSLIEDIKLMSLKKS
ncbi:hypothetical protein SLEP1_g5820 [Rubroshorea leprosula]|uniref:Glycosyltransferase n=1 Tax=Rubroshorea leprosula TaxID=152421 RepID=A0AAV5I2T6_9ROSI|nr:hypothetical protein SLEP1_g5820 [Rubroshorea leprosula]